MTTSDLAFDPLVATDRSTDRSGRRRFLRAGGALVLTGGAVASRPALADCDRTGGVKNPKEANSDSDQGANADSAGCGRREPPKISQAPARRESTVVAARVTRIDADGGIHPASRSAVARLEAS